MIDPEELIKKAFQALLDGDLAERDRLCALAQHVLKQRVRFLEGGELMPGEPILVNIKGEATCPKK